jgi:hypothetical protein
MSDPIFMVADKDGRMHSECLHWEGFPSILWDVTSTAGYPIPPRYVGREFMEMGVTRCQVHMTLLPLPAHPECLILEIKPMGHRLANTWDTATMRALTTFCEQHPVEVTLAPIVLFPVVQDDEPMWLDRVQHMDYLVDFHTQETILTSVRS